MSILLNIFTFFKSPFPLSLGVEWCSLCTDTSTTWTRDHHKHNTFNLLVFGKLGFCLHHDLILKNDDIGGKIHLLLQDSGFCFFSQRNNFSIFSKGYNFTLTGSLHNLLPYWCFVVFDSLRPHGLEATRLLCPWDFPSKNPGVGCYFHLQGILLIQGSNSRHLCLLYLIHWWFFTTSTTWEAFIVILKSTSLYCRKVKYFMPVF